MTAELDSAEQPAKRARTELRIPRPLQLRILCDIPRDRDARSPAVVAIGPFLRSREFQELCLVDAPNQIGLEAYYRTDYEPFVSFIDFVPRCDMRIWRATHADDDEIPDFRHRRPVRFMLLGECGFCRNCPRHVRCDMVPSLSSVRCRVVYEGRPANLESGFW